MTDSINYYELLEVDKSADCETITKAYRKKAKIFHPDKVSDEKKDEVEAKFVQIAEAQDTLCDRSKRAIYDARLNSDPDSSGSRDDGYFIIRSDLSEAEKLKYFSKPYEEATQRKILRILSEENEELAPLFKTWIQIEALEILGDANAKLALGFESLEQLKALRVLKHWGKKGGDLAFYMYNKSFSDYEKAVIKNLNEDNADLFSHFNTWAQLRALEILGNENAKLALKFVSGSQLEALKVLGKENAELALEFGSEPQFYALKILGNENAELAVRIVNNSQLETLKTLGKENVELVAQLVDSNHCEVFNLLAKREVTCVYPIGEFHFVANRVDDSVLIKCYVEQALSIECSEQEATIIGGASYEDAMNIDCPENHPTLILGETETAA